MQMAADYDNYKKRAQKQIVSAINDANQEFALKTLRIVDDFERVI